MTDEGEKGTKHWHSELTPKKMYFPSQPFSKEQHEI